jgi:hypothetical protein
LETRQVADVTIPHDGTEVVESEPVAPRVTLPHEVDLE